MVKIAIALAIGLIAGFRIGRRMLNKEINERILYLKHLVNEVKEKNNAMVDNLARIYEASKHDTSTFTEVDQMLMDMWID